jgi:ribosomal protein S18 acetylase RimI-like enzyme
MSAIREGRSASADDAEQIMSLINAHSRRHCGEDRVGLVEILSWFKSAGKQQDDTRCWWSRDGALVAFAQVYSPEFPAAWDALHDVTVHPDQAGDDSLWDEVFAWSDRFQWSASKKGVSANVDLCAGTRIYENDSVKRSKYESLGFEHVRNETLMRVDMAEAFSGSTEVPEGIKVRRLDLDSDLQDYALAYGEAFRDHWGYTDVPSDEWAKRKMSEFEGWGDMFVPDLWFVAVDGDTIVGSVGSFLDHGNVKGRCYLYHVFVRRAWRNRRIASALLTTSFRTLKERGGKTVELHVDSENITYGLQLYRGMGMRPVWHQRLYQKTYPLPPGPG